MSQIHEHGGKSSESLLDKAVILKSLKIIPGQNILDAGCGNGYMSKEFAKLTGNNGKVYAIDTHEPSISQLKSESKQGNITVILGDITKNIEIEASSIDLVYLSNVFHGFTDSQIEGFLQEVKRILKPGGILAIVEIDKKDSPFGPAMDIRYSPDELAEAINFESVDLVEVGDYFYTQTFIYKN